MRKSFYMLGALLTMALLMSAIQASETLTKENGTTIVNTKTIGKKVRGFKGLTPLRIHIKADKIVKVEALPNQETPQYFEQARTLLKKYEGQPVKKALKMKVDAVTGATYSSEALKENVRVGLQYYKEHAK